MENRERNIQLKIRLTEKERELFEEKMGHKPVNHQKADD